MPFYHTLGQIPRKRHIVFRKPDGGLYAELIRNRTFRDDPAQPVHWSVVKDAGGEGAIALESNPVPDTALTTSLRLDVAPGSSGRVGAANEGYWGIPALPNTTYRLSFWAKAANANQALTASMVLPSPLYGVS